MSSCSSSKCLKEACAIQDCLQKNDYKDDSCKFYIRKLYECCSTMYEKNPDSESVCCPQKHLVDKKLRELT